MKFWHRERSFRRGSKYFEEGVNDSIAGVNDSMLTSILICTLLMLCKRLIFFSFQRKRKVPTILYYMGKNSEWFSLVTFATFTCDLGVNYVTVGILYTYFGGCVCLQGCLGVPSKVFYTSVKMSVEFKMFICILACLCQLFKSAESETGKFLWKHILSNRNNLLEMWH